MFGTKVGSANIVGLIIGVVIAVVIAMSLIPVVLTQIDDANLTGTNATLAALIPLFLIIALIVVITKVFGMW
jgi:hypothetical protein